MWNSQVIQTLIWIHTFLAGEMGVLTRAWDLADYTAQTAGLTFSFDACPWGIGGVLVHHGKIVSCFMDAVTDLGLLHRKLKRGATAQQALEALAVLVGDEALERLVASAPLYCGPSGRQYDCSHYGIDLESP